MVMTTGETVYTVECERHGMFDLPERSSLGAWKQVARHGFACDGDLEMRRYDPCGVFVVAQVMHKDVYVGPVVIAAQPAESEEKS